MEHWPGYERQEKTQDKDGPEGKGRQKNRHLESTYWQWPHLEHGSIGRGTLISKDGKVQWSSAADTSCDAGQRWLPLGKPVKVFPGTRLPRVDIHEDSASQQTMKGLQYLRTYFPDANFPGELLGNILETDAREMHHLKSFDPFLGNLLEILPSHHTQNEFTIVFSMGEQGEELNISRFRSDDSGDMVVSPAGRSSVTFETPILQISSVVRPLDWFAAPSSTLLVRTHTSSSLLRLEYSKVTRELDIARSETGDVPIMDSRILASGPDIVAVNRSGKVYKCNTYHGGKAMQLIGGQEISNDDHFWQLGVTRRCDECFLASYKAVRHIDLRSGNAVSNVFSLSHPNAIVTSFESPMHDYVSRITSTSDVIWLDDRFRKRPLLSFKHYRSFDRTLKVLTAIVSGTSFSLLTSRRSGLVTLYDVGKGSDGLLRCNSIPSCLPHDGPILTAYDGHALVSLPSDTDLAFLQLCQHGSIHRQDIHVVQREEDRIESVRQDRVTHQWGEDVQELERRFSGLQIDFGSSGGRHFTEVNLRGAYERMFTYADEVEEDGRNAFEDMLSRLPDVWQGIEELPQGMRTTLEVLSNAGERSKNTSRVDFLAGTDVNSKHAFNVLIGGQFSIQKFASTAPWHYNIHDTSIPGLDCHSGDCSVLNEYLKELTIVPGTEEYGLVAQREADARERLVVDLALSNDVYSTKLVAKPRSLATGESAPNTEAYRVEMDCNKEPPEIKFGYFHPVRKTGADHYAGDKGLTKEQDPGVLSPLGVRLLLTEWELGSDPNDYTYRDPYGLTDAEAEDIPRYRRLPAAAPMAQKKQVAPQRPPLVVAAAQPPVVQVVERAPSMVQSQTVQRTRSQQLERGFDASSQEPMVSTQVVPGRFGGRPNVGKKQAKKRIGGF